MRNGGRASRPLTAMAVHLGLATCFTVLACLLQPSVSEHKKKIIVKVPHIIKHIHHDVYKPVHVHKVHAKKVEHHHEEHEERLPKWKPKRGKGGKRQAHGSYSHLQPVHLHEDSQEHIEHSAGHRQGLEYGAEQEYGRGHEYRNLHDYSQEADWSPENDSGERRTRPVGGDPPKERAKWESIDLGGWFGRGKENDDSDEWLISSEDLRELREDYGFPGGKGSSVTGQKRKKDKPLSLPAKPTTPEIENDGWKPIMDFSGWKDVGELHKKGPREYAKDQFNYSGEDESEFSREEDVRGGRDVLENAHSKRKKVRKNSQKSGKWSKQIEVREPSSEEDPQLRQRPIHGYAYQPKINPLPPVPQISHVQVQNSPEQINTQSQTRKVHWQAQPDQQNKWPEPLPSPQAQHWPHPQPSIWQTSTTPPQTHATQPSSVVWSGHHLQTPQHTMWHVQQHNVQHPVQVQANPSPPPVFPVHSPPLLPFRQPSSLQSQQASVPIHRVAVPEWPPTQKTPGGVMQQWEQTVHMGDGAGPASSYKVEVINYSGH